MCKGKTLAGEPCRLKEEPYCRHHKDQKDENIVVPYPIKDLTKKIQRKIELKSQKKFSKTDGPGHIYIYYIDADKKDSYYKIGRTSTTVKKRLSKWKDSILKKSYAVKHEKKSERMIHLYLDHVRVYRYYIEEEKGYCTVWKSTGEAVTKKDEVLKNKYKLEGRNKHIEWFKMDLVSIKKVLEKVLY